MGDVVNLRTTRKRAKREQEANVAAAQRLTHGTSKTERSLMHTRAEKLGRDLDLHRIEPGEDK